MDADSSYGGSDTAQDSTSGHHSSIETTTPDTNHHENVNNRSITEIKINDEPNQFYHKNEVTLPINYDDETDFHKAQSKLPQYMSTANLNISESLENHSNLEQLSKTYNSTNRLNVETPKSRKKSVSGVDNPAFHEDEPTKIDTNGHVKSTFGENKAYNNGDLNGLGLTSPTKSEESAPEAVNLELINLKPTGNDVAGPYENGKNGLSSIPVKKDRDVERTNPYDEYFVPVHEHKKYMR